MNAPRKTVTALLGTLSLALPAADSAYAASATATSAAAKKKVVTTRKLVGTAIEADRWGTVQVTVTVRTTRAAGSKKVTRKYVQLGGTYTYRSDRSQFIMSQSLPLLRQEFLSAQSANVQLISGATDTTEAFEQSLHSALARL